MGRSPDKGGILMGLDMYLTKRVYVKNWDHMSEEKVHEITIKRGGKIREDIDTSRISEVIVEVMYWRKANQIHNWFVQNVQAGHDDNCKDSYVPREKLQELLRICKRIAEECPLKKGNVINGFTYRKNEVMDSYDQVPIIEKGKVMTNIRVAEELLPTADGFFFGSTEYDQWYMQDILDTIKLLEAEYIEEDHVEGHGDYYYMASW
jgi:hypothetical protein